MGPPSGRPLSRSSSYSGPATEAEGNERGRALKLTLVANIGRVTLAEIQELMADHGLALADE